MKHLIVILSLSLAFTACNSRRAFVVGKIQEASKLATTEFTVDKLVFGEKSKRILWVVKLKNAQFVAKSQAIIKTGIDLQKIKEEDIKIKGNKINILLPSVEVINFSYPAESFEEIKVLSRNVLSTKINLDDQEKFFQDAETDIRNSLQYMNMVETTQDKTRIMLKAMLKNLGYKEIYIDFKKDKLISEIIGP